MHLSTATTWSQWRILAASACHWWRWWSDTLWVTVTRSWLPSSFLCSFWLHWNWHNSFHQSVIVELSLQSHSCGTSATRNLRGYLQFPFKLCCVPQKRCLEMSGATGLIWIISQYFGEYGLMENFIQISGDSKLHLEFRICGSVLSFSSFRCIHESTVLNPS